MRLIDEPQLLGDFRAPPASTDEPASGVSTLDAVEELRTHAKAGQATALQRALGHSSLRREVCHAESCDLLLDRDEELVVPGVASRSSGAQRAPKPAEAALVSLGVEVPRHRCEQRAPWRGGRAVDLDAHERSCVHPEEGRGASRLEPNTEQPIPRGMSKLQRSASRSEPAARRSHARAANREGLP